MGAYKKGSFNVGSKINLNLITCEDKIFILSILQSYVLHWYHMYLLYPGIYRAEAMIVQHFYCTVIRNAVWKEVNNCDACQLTKRLNKNIENYQLSKMGKYHEKLCVYIIGTYSIRRKVQKESLNPKSITIINPVIVWLLIT